MTLSFPSRIGTSYNSYLINRLDKTVLIDSVDPAMLTDLLDKLDEVEKIDYIVANHGEQDHSGSIPVVMGLYPEAVLITSSKGKSVMMDHLGVPEENKGSGGRGGALIRGLYP